MHRRDVHFAETVKRAAIKALFSDDELLDRLVLKGGNLLDVVFGISSRASVDLDFSVDGDLGGAEALRIQLERALVREFAEIGLVVFDVNASEVPPALMPGTEAFWGGYQVDFKVIEHELFHRFGDDIGKIRRVAAPLGKRGSPKFEIDISKHEYCGDKQRAQLDHLAIYTYTPSMVVCEKLRAICQQMPEYVKFVGRHPSARARDFVDICATADKCGVEFGSPDMLRLLPLVFAAKQVPLHLLGEIRDYREFHRLDFAAVRATFRPNALLALRDFDFYFDAVVANVAALETLWNK